jgi:hypothetical protein
LVVIGPQGEIARLREAIGESNLDIADR